ncbi:MAG TPA: DUF3078 domain-containing protein [Bacteroidota bacterium]|nr:DUF3078 domain-containing protein [Bacteroidota bacterium]
MKRILFLCLWLLPFLLVNAQETQTPAESVQQTQPEPKHWKHSMILSANCTQVSFTDWAQGGENALAYALFLEGKSEFTHDSINWTNSYKFGYGQARLSTLGLRKTDDIINFESVFIYKLGAYINPYASVSLRTQFTEGVVYESDGSTVPVSNFFDPGYLIQSVGVGYQPISEIKTRLGVALREVITNKYVHYSDDPSTSKIEKMKVDGGVESVTDVNWKVMENVLVTSKLEIFAPIKNIDQTTIRSDNTISAKANKYISINLNVLLINDPQVQARTQIKETLALGISFTLI